MGEMGKRGKGKKVREEENPAKPGVLPMEPNTFRT
jgi:hypothetical protein